MQLQTAVQAGRYICLLCIRMHASVFVISIKISR